MDFYPIVGRKGTGLHDRLPIETLQKDHPYQFTLFILSFLVLQDRGSILQKNSDLNLSSSGPLPIPPGSGAAPSAFLNIAGIHGKPYQAWPGDCDSQAADFNASDPKDTNPVPSRFGGYCNHGSVLFPTWHRPYVLLIEQAIGDLAIGFANDFTEQEKSKSRRWKQAAQDLRFPYWDWAEERVQHEGLPSVFYSKTVEITLPEGKKAQIENPLSYFPIEQVPPDFTDETDEDTNMTAYFTRWTRTYRHADSRPYRTDSNIEDLQKVLKEHAADVRAKVAHLFTFGQPENPESCSKVWDEFSNHTTQSLRSMDYYNAGSLEGVHDSMHDILGGNGHMAYPDYAGFDPIFFFHHANVDRLFALWEFCYHTIWMGDGYVSDSSGTQRSYPWTQSQGTYHEVYNEQLRSVSALAPFRTESGAYWTSDQTRFLDKSSYPKYYSYPPIAGVKVDKDATQEERLKAAELLSYYYGLNPSEHSKTIKIKPPLFKTIEGVPDKHKAIENYRHFVVVVKLLEHAFNGPYSFKLYHRSPRNFSTEPVLIGSVSVFARPDNSKCEACSRRRTAGTTVRGIIPLHPQTIDDILQRHSETDSDTIKDEKLTSLIKNVFHAVLLDPRGKELGRAENIHSVGDPMARHLTPLKVTLMSSSAAQPDSKSGPIQWFDWRNHGDVFTGGHNAWKSRA